MVGWMRGEKRQTVKVRTARKMQPYLVRIQVCLHVPFGALLCSFWPNSNKFMTAPHFLFEKLSKKFLYWPPVCYLMTLWFMCFPLNGPFLFVLHTCRVKKWTSAFATANIECKHSCKQRCMQTRALLSARGRPPTCCDTETAAFVEWFPSRRMIGNVFLKWEKRTQLSNQAQRVAQFGFANAQMCFGWQEATL